MRVSVAGESELEAIAALVNSAYRGDSSRVGWTTEADLLGGQRTDPATLRADLAAHPGAVLLTVRPDLQARGIGRRLLQEAERYAAARGGRRMRMTVITVRDTLLEWYERRGYRRTGELSPFPYGKDEFGRPRREDLQFEALEKALER
jgi:GNAT superfamily N-acetyltransferase